MEFQFEIGIYDRTIVRQVCHVLSFPYTVGASCFCAYLVLGGSQKTASFCVSQHVRPHYTRGALYCTSMKQNVHNIVNRTCRYMIACKMEITRRAGVIICQILSVQVLPCNSLKLLSEHPPAELKTCSDLYFHYQILGVNYFNKLLN